MKKATDKWANFLNGALTLQDMSQIYGNKICLVVPERFGQMPKLISKLQRDLLVMHQCSMATVSGPDWKIGLLFHVKKFPLGPVDHAEIIQLGLFMSCQDFLHSGLWGFVGKLEVMNPPRPPPTPAKKVQLGLGWRAPKPVQVHRDQACFSMI